MRAQAKVTSKGQVTIPALIREELGIETGNMLVFEVATGYARVSRLRPALEIVAELREQHPELRRPCERVTKEAAVATYFRQRAGVPEDEGDELYVIGRGVHEVLGGDEDA